METFARDQLVLTAALSEAGRPPSLNLKLKSFLSGPCNDSQGSCVTMYEEWSPQNTKGPGLALA